MLISPAPEELFKQFNDFIARIERTDSQELKDLIQSLLPYNKGGDEFLFWALMQLEIIRANDHSKNLAAEVISYQDRINELLGNGYDVIQERDLLKSEVIKLCEQKDLLVAQMQEVISHIDGTPFFTLPAARNHLETVLKGLEGEQA